MAKKILILEDNADRRAAMRECLQDRLYQFETTFFDEAEAMIRSIQENWNQLQLIVLDHDLELKSDDASGKCVDPGTGRSVAEFLARRTPTCPVVIHTTNSTAAVAMEELLREAQWETHRVVPWGDLEWIPTQWFRAVRRAIVGRIKTVSK